MFHFVSIGVEINSRTNRYGNDLKTAELMAVIQTIISFFLDDQDPLKWVFSCFHWIATMSKGFVFQKKKGIAIK
jgi:hypothetical protein